MTVVTVKTVVTVITVVTGVTVLTVATVTEVKKHIGILTIKIVVVFTTMEGGVNCSPSSSRSLVVGWSVHNKSSDISDNNSKTQF